MKDNRESTQGYQLQAPLLAAQYDSVNFRDVHEQLLGLIGVAPLKMLDIGSGTGRDALGFASLGYDVTAIEPVEAMREIAMAKAGADKVRWFDDGLPDLVSVGGQTFDIVMLNAVWMHIDHDEREKAMPVVAALVGAGGWLSLSLRHGPVPPKRRMFEVSADEVIEQASNAGLTLVSDERALARQDRNRAAGVTWSRLIFRRR